MVAQVMSMLTITWLLSMVVGMVVIEDGKKCKQIAGIFDHHADTAIQCGAHHPMEHIQGFTRSNCLPSFGKCLCCIALAAAMVDNFDCKHKALTKHNF
jgi:hypothetical protein